MTAKVLEAMTTEERQKYHLVLLAYLLDRGYEVKARTIGFGKKKERFLQVFWKEPEKN